MDGRQYFPNYGGNYQQVPEFSGAGYGRGYNVPGNYFVPGSNAGKASAIFCFLLRAVPTFVWWQFTKWRLLYAVAPQHLGGPLGGPGMHTNFGQQNEDPALFVTFDEEEDDFPLANRQVIGRSQPMQPRRQPPQGNTTSQSAAANRQQPPAGPGPRPPARPASAGPTVEPGRKFSAAEQELEELKRRIAEKEKQMKAKRQTGQGFTGAPVRSRPNPAHGPVLRGLHRKQPLADNPLQDTREADLFLQQVASELPAGISSCLVQC